MNKALPAEQYIYDTQFKASSRNEIIGNLLEIYNLPFEMETVENLFEFPETIVGDDWDLWAVEETDNGRQYCIINSKDDESAFFFPAPQTIGHFISDCDRIWKKDLIWDGNLIKRKFNYVH